MIYERVDIDVTRALGRLYGTDVTDILIEKCLRQTEIFHYLLVCKLIDKARGISDFDLNLGDINEKLDDLLNGIKEKKEEPKE